MPESPPRRCSSCGELVKGACPNCSGWKRKPASWPNGASDPRWRKVRARRLNRDPFCWCGAPATTADHLDGTDYSDDSGIGFSWLNIDMTRSLCDPHHASRTGRQGAAARGRR